MTNDNTGLVSVAIIAGHIRATEQPVHPSIGQQIDMGPGLYAHITADVAKQWISVLEPIAKEEK